MSKIITNEALRETAKASYSLGYKRGQMAVANFVLAAIAGLAPSSGADAIEEVEHSCRNILDGYKNE